MTADLRTIAEEMIWQEGGDAEGWGSLPRVARRILFGPLPPKKRAHEIPFIFRRFVQLIRESSD